MRPAQLHKADPVAFQSGVELFSENGKRGFNNRLEPVTDIPDPLQSITQGIQEADAGTESLNHALFRELATWEDGGWAS